MKNKQRFTIALLFLTSLLFSQNSIMDFGAEIQVYPTGIIPGIRFEKSFNDHNTFTLRFGYQIIDHRDQGCHDDETGKGYGLTLGVKRYFRENFRGPSLGLRLDYWKNTIDWENKIPNGVNVGRSEITVLQPTAEFGWAFVLGEKFVLTPAAAFGFEFNVETEGEETGQGPIFLLGLTAAYRFNE